jgi:tetratricopeptide (TPR) repeat protein
MLGALGTALFATLMVTTAGLMMGWAVWHIFGMCVQDKLISFMEMLVILVVIFGLMAAALALPPPVGVGAFILLFLLLLFIPFLPRVANALKLQRMIRSDIAGFEAALKRNPEVPYPHRRLGDIYLEHEDFDRAIEHYQAYVDSVEAKPDVRHRLQRAIAKRRQREMGLRICPSCGTENLVRAIRCDGCGFYLQGPREIVDVLTAPEMMRRWKWLIVVFFVPGLVAGLLTTVIPPAVILTMFACSVIATGVFLYGLAREERNRIVREGMTPQERIIEAIQEPPEVRALEDERE